MLENILRSIDGKSYGAYQDILGTYQFETFVLFVDRVQKDPYAPPSRMRLRVPWSQAGFPSDLVQTKSRKIALCDFLTRKFWTHAHDQGIDQAAQGGRWCDAKGGDLQIAKPGQVVLQRTSVVLVPNEYLEARFTVNLPGQGRQIIGSKAGEILCYKLPQVMHKSMIFKSLPYQELQRHIHVVEDQDALRGMLSDKGLVAFVGNGSILPRSGGASQLPMSPGECVPFESPPSLQYEFQLPNQGRIVGMGIPKGITLLVGGGFHGKSTVLQALELGVYNHIPGDGREYTVTDSSAMKIRAEDGRNVSCVDISTFINNLPGDRDTTRFTSADASGSTSQATNIIEALESGSSTLLLDEDTCATNFMIRDKRMQMLVAKEKEPITPFLHRVGSLYQQRGVSTILVVGGSGDYFDVANVVIMMDNYVPRDVTSEAKTIAKTSPSEDIAVELGPIRVDRMPIKSSIADVITGKRSVKLVDTAFISNEELDLSGVSQIVETCQTQSIIDGMAVAAKQFMGPNSTLKEILDRLDGAFNDDSKGNGLDILGQGMALGIFSRPRRQELAAALNRYRALKFCQK